MTEKLDDEHPEVTLLHSERGGRADVWHSDFTYAPEPMMGAVLRFVKGPAAGGDTMWASMYAAYEQLSDPVQELLEGLTALHSPVPDGRMDMESEHPIVRIHPETGRRSLFVNRLFTTRIPQLSPVESTGLLSMLFAWAERPELTCRWRWEEGDVAVWDNRCTMHYAIGDYSDERVAHRVAVLGDAPVGPPARWPHYDLGPVSAATAAHLRRR
jgi:taurine dioxygenase